MELGPYSDRVTGLASHMKTKTLWITCNTTSPIVIDARTGSNVTSCIFISFFWIVYISFTQVIYFGLDHGSKHGANFSKRKQQP